MNGYSIVTYQRPLRAADRLDLPVYTNTSQPIIWAIGPLNEALQVSYHHHYNKVTWHLVLTRLLTLHKRFLLIEVVVVFVSCISSSKNYLVITKVLKNKNLKV